MTKLERAAIRFATLSMLAAEVKASFGKGPVSIAQAFPCQTPDEDTPFIVHVPGDGEWKEVKQGTWCHNQRQLGHYGEPEPLDWDNYCGNCKRRSSILRAAAYLRMRRGYAQAALKRIVAANRNGGRERRT